MWQINVAGTARVLEAITEANREEMLVKKFIYPSSTLVYGGEPARRSLRETDPASELPLVLGQQSRGPKSDPQTAGTRICALSSIYVLRAPAFLGPVRTITWSVLSGQPGRASRAPLLCPGGAGCWKIAPNLFTWTIWPV